VGGRVIRGLNENYGRELLELHTVGVDAGYTQGHVIDAARCFTGWGIDNLSTSGSFVYRPAQHDTGAQSVFGLPVPAGGGRGALRAARSACAGGGRAPVLHLGPAPLHPARPLPAGPVAPRAGSPTPRRRAWRPPRRARSCRAAATAPLCCARSSRARSSGPRP